MKIIPLLSALLLVTLAGCVSRELIAEDVLQVPKHAVLRTSCNLWYTEPDEMTSENIQIGKILPIGTEARILKMTEDYVIFKAIDTEFRLELSSNQNEAMEDFARRLFTTKSAKNLLKDTSPVQFEKIKRGIVSQGMSKKEVLAAFGMPVMSRTISLDNTTWIYQADRVKSKRVVFKDDKVVRVLELD